jgi:coenzyme F420-reducing hydrogenase beta subunit
LTNMRNRRVGVMTWFTYENYGTALQAIALQHVLQEMGYSPELINYRPRATRGKLGKRSLRELVDAGKSKLTRPELIPYASKERKLCFDEFIANHARISEAANSLPELRQLSKNYDAVICGSDQIWSPNCFDENYYLQFVGEPNRKIAYAPSFGVSAIADPEIKERIRTLIASFASISARELQGKEIIHELTGKDVPVVADPTLLLSQEEWRGVAGFATPGNGKGYLLCYFLGNPTRYEEAARKTADNLGLQLVTIPTFMGHDEGRPDGEIGPAEFISLIAGASYVCTDSFHGMVMSTIFEKPFTAFKRFSDADPTSQNSRVVDFLAIAGLTARLVGPDQPQPSAECDFAAARKRLSDLRDSSLKYLQDALETAFATKANERLSKPIEITKQCCGCGACASICPKSAIRICEDDRGFQQYSIDNDLCIACGACIRVCPMRTVTAPMLADMATLWSYKSADRKKLTKSASGGVGADVAELMSSQGAHVFGCVYCSQDDRARHEEVSGSDLDKLRGSKYLQSDCASALKKAAAADGKLVFFGTPCQIAGLDALLRIRKKRDNAVLVDLICHGVPSQNLWRRYLEERQMQSGLGPHPKAWFRWKKDGWSSRKMMRLESSGKELLSSEPKDDFYAFFSNSLCNARCCYECPYRERSAADIRIGDYWGPRFEKDREGVSMVLSLTESGRAVIERLGDNGAELESQDVREYWDVQFPYNTGVPLHWDEIINDLSRGAIPLHSLRNKYCAGIDQARNIQNLKSAIKRIIRRK